MSHEKWAMYPNPKKVEREQGLSKRDALVETRTMAGCSMKAIRSFSQLFVISWTNLSLRWQSRAFGTTHISNWFVSVCLLSQNLNTLSRRQRYRNELLPIRHEPSNRTVCNGGEHKYFCVNKQITSSATKHPRNCVFCYWFFAVKKLHNNAKIPAFIYAATRADI